MAVISLRPTDLFFALLVSWSCVPSFHTLPVRLESGAINEECSKQDITKDSRNERCNLCVDGFELVRYVVETNLTLEEVFPLVNTICVRVVGSGGEYMCPGFIYSYGPVIQYVFAHAAIQPQKVCENLHFCSKACKNKRSPSLEDVLAETERMIEKRLVSNLKLRNVWATLKASLSKMEGGQDGDKASWKTRLPTQHYSRHKDVNSTFISGKVSSRKNVDKALVDLKRRGPIFKSLHTTFSPPRDGVIRFLHLSDIHLDHDYDEGSSTDCGLYTCCRHWYNGTGKAGHYGDYMCDIPLPTLDLLLDTIKRLEPPPHFIIYTGDNPPHDVWNETWTSQLQATEFIVEYLSRNLPHITIYPAMGNHETWPESEYMGTLFPYKTLTSNLAAYWEKWADFPFEALETIAEGGYYSIEIMNKLRLISFNSDYGYALNFYSYLNADNKHFKAQLVWMEKQLTLAEQNGDKVLLVAHIPPGDLDNNPEYGEFYLNLTKRFRDVIIGHLFGHTHKDQFQLVQDTDGVHGVVLVSPSVTTFGHINPSFRVFSMDVNSFLLLGYEQHHLNITRANELHSQGSTARPEFELSYTTFNDYNLKDLSPVQWASLVERFQRYPALLDKYNYNIQAKSIQTDATCDAACKRSVLCSVSNVVSSDYSLCMAGS